MDLSEAVDGPENRECAEHGTYVAMRIIGRWSGCPVCSEENRKAEHERQQIESARLRQEASKAMRYAAIGIPPRFEDATMESYRVESDKQQAALNRARWFVETWEERRKLGTSMIFYGNAGNGKTHLGYAICRKIVEAGRTAKLVEFDEMLGELKDTYGAGAAETSRQCIARYVGLDLLVIDEVGVGDVSDHDKRQIFSIINRRYKDCAPTLLITNLDVEKLKAWAGDRIIDRMREGGGKAVNFDWQSGRR